MRLAPIFSLIAIAVAAPAFAADVAGAASSDAALVRDLEAKSWVAWQNHDAKFFDQFLSEDHVEIHNYGITGKAPVVAGVGSPTCVVQSYALGPFALTRVSADTLLLTYRAEQDTRCGGQKVPSPVWASSLYVLRGGRWVNVMYQQTPVAHG